MGNPFPNDTIEGQHHDAVVNAGRNPGFGARQRRQAPSPSPEPRAAGGGWEGVQNAAGVIAALIILGLLFGS